MRVTRVRETRDEHPGAFREVATQTSWRWDVTGRPGPEGWRANVKNAVLR